MNIIVQNIIISIAIYFAIATILIIVNGKSNKIGSSEEDLNFEELAINYDKMPSLNFYICRDNVKLSYRHYPAQTDTTLILLHGSGWHSQYFFPLAKYISSENIANVYTPDLRGHGMNPIKRGDINYINQLEDDLLDFLVMVKKNNSNSKVIIGGHSSGGGLAIRFAGSKYGKNADAYMLLSPFLKYNAPTMRSKSGGWAYAHMPRIVGLSMLNNVGIKWFNGLKVIDFNMPEEYRDGTETLSYSFRLITGYAPRNYKRDFARMNQKALIAVGSNDESFIAEKFLPEVSKYKEDIEVIKLESLTHMSIVVGEKIRPVIKKWINELNL